MKIKVNKYNEWILAVGIPLVTLTLTKGVNFDPTNLPKMLMLSTVSFGLFFSSILDFKYQFKKIRLILICISLFLFSYLLSVLFSASPFTLKFYGAFGRNTGLLTYLSLSLIFASAVLYKSKYFARNFALGLITAFSINVIYSGFQLLGIDPVGWNNFFHTILGTFGNPDFISAFLAMGFAATLPYIFDNKQSKTIRLFCIIISFLALFEIIKSRAIQGILIALLSVFIFALVRIYLANKRFSFFLGILGFILFLIGMFGIFQKGPLAEILYKSSVTLRGFYWRAGLEMFKKNILFGLGPDTYGTWYQRTRSTSSVVPPGSVETVTNASHNVFIDILASAGIFAFFTYILLVFSAIWITLSAIKKNQTIPTELLAIFLAYLAYLWQSVVSINQIGLAVWGWSLPGVLISSFIWQKDKQNFDGPNKKLKNSENKTFSQATFGLLLGFIIAFPAWNADSNWLAAFKSRNVDQVLQAAKNWPLDSRRLTEISLLLDNNKLYAQSQEINKIAISHDPDYYDAWRAVYVNPLSTESEKQTALENLKRLDPLNPRWK